MSPNALFAARPAPLFSRALFFSVVLLFPVMDLLIAYFYFVSGIDEVIVIRYYRDSVCVLLAVLAFLSRDLPYGIRATGAAYGALATVYFTLGLIVTDLPFSVMVQSLGTLLIPLSLSMAGYTAIHTARDMRRLIVILSFYGIATVLFGMWEVSHTEFWTQSVGLGRYMVDLKHLPYGFQSQVFLPWSFSGYNDVRRAAGLLAAPLAQGFFLAVVGVAAFAFWRSRSLVWATLVMTLCFYGAIMSQTRAGIFTAACGMFLYLLYPSPERRSRQVNRVLLVVFMAFVIPISFYYLSYTVEQKDESTPGHVRALIKNFDTLSDVSIVGSGVGAAGSEAASRGYEIEGGGEGAFFSIAYQLGLPGLVVFWAFAASLFRFIYAQRRTLGRHGEVARAIAFLFPGAMISGFSSEHLLSFSGMAAFWFLVGGYIGYCRRQVAAPILSLPPVSTERSHALPT